MPALIHAWRSFSILSSLFCRAFLSSAATFARISLSLSACSCSICANFAVPSFSIASRFSAVISAWFNISCCCWSKSSFLFSKSVWLSLYWISDASCKIFLSDSAPLSKSGFFSTFNLSAATELKSATDVNCFSNSFFSSSFLRLISLWASSIALKSGWYMPRACW